jgi:hypothetical protein
MMDISQDLYAKLLCQISGRINEEGDIADETLSAG